MITKIGANNFKSWERSGHLRFAPVTGLFGTNSSGKTSILQILLTLRQTVESSDRAAVLSLGGERSLVQLGTFRELIFQHELERHLSFAISWDLPRVLRIDDPTLRSGTLFKAERLAFECQIKSDPNEKLFVEKFSYRFDQNSFGMSRIAEPKKSDKYELSSTAKDFSFTRARGRAWDLPPPTKFYGFPDQTFSYFQNAGFLGELQLELEELFSRVYYLGPLREPPERHYVWAGSEPADMGRRGERAVEAILASRAKGRYLSPGPRKKKQTLEERIAYWLKELGLIHSFRVNVISKESNLYEVKVRKSASSPEVYITDVGFGVSQILPVLVLCYYAPEGSTILLEQPELHLHPSVQSGLADVMIDVARNRDVQVIFESHSEHLLRRLQRRIAEEVFSPSDVEVYFCELEPTGRSSARKLQIDLFGNIANWPKDFFGDEFGEISRMSEAAMRRKQLSKNA